MKINVNYQSSKHTIPVRVEGNVQPLHDKICTALSKKFNCDKSDFSIVHYKKVDKVISAVVLTATEGVDLGNLDKAHDSKRSWNKLMAKDDDRRFIIEVDGKEIDTREPIDGELLKAVDATNPEISEWIWRTGEKDKAGRDLAPIARLNEGEVRQYWVARSYDYRNFRFRPAVVLDLEVATSSEDAVNTTYDTLFRTTYSKLASR